MRCRGEVMVPSDCGGSGVVTMVRGEDREVWLSMWLLGVACMKEA